MTRETFTKDKVTAMNMALQDAPKTNGKLSKGDVLRELAPTLKMLREERGYTLEALVELLAKQGLNVKVSTIQGALKKKGGGTKRKAAAAPPPPSSPQTSPPPPTASTGTVAAGTAAVKNKVA
jgi:hypothetical protein